MSGQIVLKGNLQVRTAEGKNVFLEQLDLVKNVQEYDIRRIKVVGGAIDVPVEFAGVSDVTFLYLQSDRGITLKINGAATPTGKGNNFLLTGAVEAPISSLSCSNPGVEVATVLIVLG